MTKINGTPWTNDDVKKMYAALEEKTLALPNPEEEITHYSSEQIVSFINSLTPTQVDMLGQIIALEIVRAEAQSFEAQQMENLFKKAQASGSLN